MRMFKKETAVREVISRVDATHMNYEMYCSTSGTETKMMEIHYHKK